jgi:hypothetical protein
MHDFRDAADGVSRFCQKHDISRGSLYALWRRGEGPRFMRIGDRRLISCEASAEWRREREAATCVSDSSPFHGGQRQTASDA